MIEFKDQDREFIAWREMHPGGFVVNTYRNPSASYLKLHRADCRTFRPPFTKNYIKLCATSVDDLNDWAARNVAGFHGLDPCKTCKPEGWSPGRFSA